MIMMTIEALEGVRGNWGVRNSSSNRHLGILRGKGNRSRG